MPGQPNESIVTPEVMIFDEATGKASPVTSGGSAMPLEAKKKLWEPFAAALYQHMKAKGLDKAMHWGYPLDGEFEHDQVVVLFRNAYRRSSGPAVPTRSARAVIPNRKYYDVFGTVRYFDNWPGFRMSMGFNAPQVHLAIPRIDSSVTVTDHCGHIPFGFRVLVDHALALGRCGFNRVGADEWASIHYDGMQDPHVDRRHARALHPLARSGRGGAQCPVRGPHRGYPGSRAPASTWRKALDSSCLPVDLAARARDVLDSHFRQTSFFQNKLCIYELEKSLLRLAAACRGIYTRQPPTLPRHGRTSRWRHAGA